MKRLAMTLPATAISACDTTQQCSHLYGADSGSGSMRDVLRSKHSGSSLYARPLLVFLPKVMGHILQPSRPAMRVRSSVGSARAQAMGPCLLQLIRMLQSMQCMACDMRHPRTGSTPQARLHSRSRARQTARAERPPCASSQSCRRTAPSLHLATPGPAHCPMTCQLHASDVMPVSAQH